MAIKFVFTMMMVIMSSFGCSTESADLVPAPPPTLEKSGSIKQVYAEWFTVGVAIPEFDKLTDAEKQLLTNQFGAVTPENFMKPDRFPVGGDFSKSTAVKEIDGYVDSARLLGLELAGHTLVWHRKSDYFLMNCSTPTEKATVRERVRQHVFSVASHFAGRIESWDVWNEALSDVKGEYFRHSKCSDDFTQELILEAFIVAHQADPSAKLFLTDYGIEYPSKREKALRLVKYLREHDAPIFGIGIQGHYRLDNVPFQFVEETLSAFPPGIKIAFTELDIDVTPKETCSVGKTVYDPSADGLSNEVSKRLADQYARLFALFIDHAEVIPRVSFWALHDGRSWLNREPCKKTNHPMLFDRHLIPKPALSAVLAIAAEKRKTKTQLLPYHAFIDH